MVASATGLVIDSGPFGCKIDFTLETQLQGHSHIGTYGLGMHPSMLSCSHEKQIGLDIGKR